MFTELFDKYNKHIYLISMVFFTLSGLTSILKNLFMLGLAIFVLITPIKFIKLKDISKADYAISAILVFLYVSLAYGSKSIINVMTLLLGYYFIIETIALLESYLSGLVKNKTILPDKSTPVSLLETIVIAVSSLITMTLFTTSSPLFIMNLWDDTNCYFTIGRCIKNGYVLYRDIFDHKGPYIYFIHALAAMISENSFIGVYFVELICCFVFSYFSWKIVHLFYTPKKYSLFLIPLTIIGTYSIVPFHFGGSAEELCFPFLTIVLYFCLKAEREDRIPNRTETIIIGLITGFIFFIKFTFCGMIFGYLIYIVYRMISKKQQKQILVKIGEFLIGFIVSIIPIVIYFGVNHAIDSFFEVYFYDNLFLYGVNNENLSSGNFYNAMGDTLACSRYLFYGLILSIFMVTGLKKNYKIMHGLMFLISMICVYAPSVRLFYYCYILFSLTPLGLVLLSSLFDSFCKRLSSIKFHPERITCFVLAVLTIYMFSSHANTTFISVTKDILPQYIFATKIKETPDAKILTYDVLDAGFYYGSGVLPATRYYCRTNITKNIPGAQEGLEQEISDGKFDYIITISNDHDWEQYEPILSVEVDNNDLPFSLEEVDYVTYYLYERVN